MADLAREVVDDHFRHGGVPVDHAPERLGGDQPALRVPVGFGPGRGGPAVEDLDLADAGAWLQDVEDLDLAAAIRAEDFQGALDHHEDAWDVLSLVEDRRPVRVPPELAHPGEFLRLGLWQPRQVFDPS